MTALSTKKGAQQRTPKACLPQNSVYTKMTDRGETVTRYTPRHTQDEAP